MLFKGMQELRSERSSQRPESERITVKIEASNCNLRVDPQRMHSERVALACKARSSPTNSHLPSATHVEPGTFVAAFVLRLLAMKNYQIS